MFQFPATRRSAEMILTPQRQSTQSDSKTIEDTAYNLTDHTQNRNSNNICKWTDLTVTTQPTLQADLGTSNCLGPCLRNPIIPLLNNQIPWCLYNLIMIISTDHIMKVIDLLTVPNETAFNLLP